MKGDLYGCIGIFSTIKTDKYEIFRYPNERKKLENELAEMIQSKFSPRFKPTMVAIHPIIDVNKIERQVCIQTDDGSFVRIGKSSNKLLIGVFFKNRDLNMYKISKLPINIMDRLRQQIFIYLSNIVGDQALQEIKLYGEAKEYE
jgi:hypothetical protein